MSDTTDRVAFVVLDRPGGRPILFNGRPLLVEQGTGAGGGSPGAGTGTGGTGAGAGAITQQVTPAGTVPFYVGNYGSSAVTSPRLSWAQAFVDGEVPAGSRVTSTAFPDLQQDAESYWPSGALRCAAFCGTYSGTIAPGANALAPLKGTSGAPSRTDGKTLADVRALGIRMEVREGVTGAVTRTLTLAGILDEFGARAGWACDDDALGGVTVVRQGAACIDVAAWRYFRDASGAGNDRWLKGYILVRLWADGVREIAGGVGHENVYGPHKLGTFGQSTALPMQSFSLRVEMFDAAGRLPVTGGGPNDPAVEQWTAANLPGGSTVAPPPASTLVGQGIPVAFSGPGAGSLVSGRAYYVFGGTLFNDYEGWSPASYGQGSGAVTATPMLQLKAGSLLWLYGADGERVVRGGTRPTVLPGHDTDYAAKAGMFPRMDRRITPDALGFTATFHPNRWWSDYNTEATGDGARELRVGEVNFPHCGTLLRPFDRDFDRYTRVLALSVLVAPWAWTDERKAQPAVTDGGPNRDDATTYPGLAPLNRNLRYYRGNPYGPGSPAWYIPDNYLAELRPFVFNYNVLDFSAHQPDHATLAYYRTGDYAYLKAKLHHANVYQVCPQPGERDKEGANGEKLRGNMFHGEQPRAIAWGGLRSHRTAATILPDAHPYKPVVVNAIVDSGKWMALWRSAIDQRYVAMGDFTAKPWEPFLNLQPWHNSFAVAELCMCIKNGWTGLLPALQWAVNGTFLDILRPAKGGSTFMAGCHHLQLGSDDSNNAARQNSYFGSVRDMVALNLNATPYTPDTMPANDILGGGWNAGDVNYNLHSRSYAAVKHGALILCVDVLDRLGAASAGEQIAAAPAVLADLEARFQRPPLSGIQGLAADPVWAYVPERLAL